jgi:hypothetical protein
VASTESTVLNMRKSIRRSSGRGMVNPISRRDSGNRVALRRGNPRKPCVRNVSDTHETLSGFQQA